MNAIVSFGPRPLMVLGSIVAHEVINQGYDRHQLAPMALKAKQATDCAQITALADRGYFSGDQVLLCEGTGVAPIVPCSATYFMFSAVTLKYDGTSQNAVNP